MSRRGAGRRGGGVHRPLGGLARTVELLDPAGPGSRTRPHPTRTLYGDGTVVAPLYRPTNRGRQDPDAAQHHSHHGAVWGTNLVTVAVRGAQPRHRVIVAVDRVAQPGGEAATAVAAIRRVIHCADGGIQAVAYDGALRGVHHETLMRDLGVVVVNKPHGGYGDDAPTVPLGQWTHQPGGRRCTHTLVAHRGAVCDSQLDDRGQLQLSEPLARKQVRRYPRRRNGGWRFTLGVTVACPREPFVVWVSPHRQPHESSHRRADQLRLVPPTDPHFARLYGLRNDAENINANYKRTLPGGRAAARGWQRQLLDLLSWALLVNTYAWQQHRTTGDPFVAASA